MNRVIIFTKKEIEAIPNIPVTIKPFDEKIRKLAYGYKLKLDKQLAPYRLKATLRGSISLGIEGKGEVDLCIFVPHNKWLTILKYFINYYRRIETLEKEYARFIDFYQDIEIEIALLQGERTKIEKRLSKYLKNDPKKVKDYIRIKRKYAYSKRTYLIQKDKFFKSIIKKL